MRPKPPDLGATAFQATCCHDKDTSSGAFQQQISRETTPMMLSPFGLLKPPESHPPSPSLGNGTLKPDLVRSLDEQMADAYQALEPMADRGAETKAFLRRLLAFTGPGWLMSIAYVDPGNLEADLQSGAQFGYSLLWALMGATLMGLGMQLIAARLGCNTRRHLAEHCRDIFDPKLRIVLWCLTEVAIIGSDIQEVVGCSIGLELLCGLPLPAGVLVTALAAFGFLFLERLGTRPLEIFFGVLIAILALAMGVLFIDTSPDKGAVLEGMLVPRLPPSAMSNVVGMIGCVIMPHNLFLHSALVQSRVVADGGEREAIRLFSIESSAAIFVSLMINTFVVAVFAKGFFGMPQTDDIGLANAGDYLGKAFGEPMKVVWALGLVAAGQSSTMTGAYAGQWVMQGYLQLQVQPWKRALITRSMALVPCLFVAVYFGGRRHGLDTLNTYLNVTQSIVLPFAVVPLLLLASSRRIMGDLVLSTKSQVAAWLCTALITAANTYLFIEQSADCGAGLSVFLFMYLAGVAFVTWQGVRGLKK